MSTFAHADGGYAFIENPDPNLYYFKQNNGPGANKYVGSDQTNPGLPFKTDHELFNVA